MDDPINALTALIDRIQDPSVFKDHLKEFADARDAAIKAQADLLATRKETEAAAAKTTADLVAAGKRADDAAAEHKASIAVNNEQIARMERMKIDLKNKKREIDLAYAKMTEDRASAAGRLKVAERKEADLDAREARLSKRELKLREAIDG